MDVHKDAGGCAGRGRAQVVRALVGELGAHIILDGLGFWLRGCAGTVIGIVARVAAGPAAATPLKRKVAVEVCPTVVRAERAIVFVGVLAPHQSCLGLFAPVRIGLQQQMNLVMVQQPGHVGVPVILCHQILGKARAQLGRGIFASVDRGHDEQFGLGTRDGHMRQAQHLQVVALAWVLGLFPRVADVDPCGQVGVFGDDCLGGVKGFFYRAVARIARNAVHLRGRRWRGLVQLCGEGLVNLKSKSRLFQPLIFGCGDRCDQITLVVMHFPGFEPGAQVTDHLAVGVIGAHHRQDGLLGLCFSRGWCGRFWFGLGRGDREACGHRHPT